MSDIEKKEDYPIVASVRKEWPPLFALSKIDRMSGGVFAYSTIRNMRAQKKIPDECFIRYKGKKVVVHRDPFLDWWNTQLEPCNNWK